MRIIFYLFFFTNILFSHFQHLKRQFQVLKTAFYLRMEQTNTCLINHFEKLNFNCFFITVSYPQIHVGAVVCFDELRADELLVNFKSIVLHSNYDNLVFHVFAEDKFHETFTTRFVCSFVYKLNCLEYLFFYYNCFN